jgi:hypothetical protein
MLYNLRTRKKINVGLESAEEPSEHIDLGLEAVELQKNKKTKKKKKVKGKLALKKDRVMAVEFRKELFLHSLTFFFCFFFLRLTLSKAIKQSKTLPSSRKPIAKSKS